MLQCEFDTADSPTSIRHHLSLAAPPSVRLAPASGQLTAVQGEDAELGCEAGGRPPARVTWHRGQHSSQVWSCQRTFLEFEVLSLLKAKM